MLAVLMLSSLSDASAQIYRRENRRGIRDVEEGAYPKAHKHFQTAIEADTLNVPALYNRAYSLHRDRLDSTLNMKKDSLAIKSLDLIAEQVAGTEHEFDTYFTKGVIAIDMQDWQGAVDAFKKCMIISPDDIPAKENYIYAKEHLSRIQD